ncbi:MAG: hypothetical protein HRU03_01510 [Nanoarchaeales archaeon]|nr:hypothetical protein [Nanoarchaeales archaeon]
MKKEILNILIGEFRLSKPEIFLLENINKTKSNVNLICERSGNSTKWVTKYLVELVNKNLILKEKKIIFKSDNKTYLSFEYLYYLNNYDEIFNKYIKVLSEGVK